MAAIIFLPAPMATAQNRSDTKQTDETRDGDPIVLTPFTVSGSSNVGYGATASGAGGRLNEKYIDTPQMIAVVTSEFMKDANLFDSSAAITYVPNVQSERLAQQVFTIRGLSSSTLYTDGFQSNDRLMVDTAFADRVEVVKGPSSASFGRGNPAGYINIVTKQPTFTRATNLNLMAGTGGVGDIYRVVLDNNGLVSQDGNTAYRFVAQDAKGSGTQMNSNTERAGALLAVTRRFPRRGDLSVSSYYFRNTNTGASGNLSFNDPTIQLAFRPTTAPVPVLPMDYVFSYNDQKYQSNMFGLAATFTYKLSEHWSLRQAANYTNTVFAGNQTNGNVGSVTLGATGYTVALPNTKNYFTSDGWSYQADFIYKREFAPLQSGFTFLAGGDYSDRSTIVGEGQNASNFNTRQPYLNFDPSAVPKDFYFARENGQFGILTDGINYSPYVHMAGTVFEGKIRASLAGRYVYVDQYSRNLPDGVPTYTKNRSPLLPAATLLFKPLKWLTIYGMVSKYQVVPSSRGAWGLDSGAMLDPTDPRRDEIVTLQATTKMREVGIKSELMGGKLFFSAAYFKVANGGALRSQLLQDPLYPGRTLTHLFTTTDDVTGWEVEIFGQPTKRLTVMGGAGFINSASAIVSGSDIVVLKYPGKPNTVYANIKYSFGRKPSEGFTATAGFKTYLSGWSANFNSVPALGNLPYPNSLTVANFGLSYGLRQGKTRIGVSVNNAFHTHSSVRGAFLAAQQGRIGYLSIDNKF